MELLFILALIGIAYCVYSDAPASARLFEVAAVAATLVLVAYAQQTGKPLAVVLPFSVLLAVPIWLVCFQMRSVVIAREQQNNVSTSQLWQDWRNEKNGPREPIEAANESLAQRLKRRQSAGCVEESPLVGSLDGPSLNAMPEAKLNKLNSLAIKAANASNKVVELPSEGTLQEDEFELAPMDNCRYKRRL